MKTASSPAKPLRKVRCAVYTRKSNEEGLDMAFNSLDAQREACEAYIASQRAEGWVLVPDRYDDGGVSGGTLERPALRRLLRDVEHGLVDVVVVYKIDRLSRSLSDFSKLVDLFDIHDVTFVSVTQSFNTTTSMGRLTLNILLSFAQFEREVIGERIRDKFAASRKRGIWMGGTVPFGYRVENRKLVIHQAEAATVRSIFERYLAIGSATVLARMLTAEGITRRNGKPFDKGWLYKLLSNRVYLGEAVHKGQAYPGEHKAIVTKEIWDKVRSIIGQSPRSRATATRCQTPALLKGLIFAPGGHAMTPTHTRKPGAKQYRYYVTTTLNRIGRDTCPIGRVPAGEIEGAVVDQLRAMLQTPEVIVRTWLAARDMERDGSATNPIGPSLTEAEVRSALVQLDPLWDELFPAEQARIVQLLVGRVEVSESGVSVHLRTDGMATLVTDMGTRQSKPAPHAKEPEQTRLERAA
ncbi:recombinase family protein [Mesorhizobium sp. RP14(2022)]|uniref:Recombinase family protein n=1 Tax=Mesorhizobium liriopis TaxID=2953882 RepID=A0ABT1CC09_9HYPH|nr:recombinase family protein [Mesorhizobium liriopis]MCO6052367.1 recombinase family protein [Mesorhizobium liriopis]